MESQIKKKTLLYGTIAILLVTFVTSFAFNFGAYTPETDTPLPPTPPPPSPPDTPLPPTPTSPSSLLTTFQSSEELRNFLVSNSEIQGPFPFYGPADVVRLNSMVEGFDAQVSSPGLVTYYSTSEPDYSTTNIQVAGVDEADIVKTDGEYLYVLSGNNLLIVKAYPPESAEVLANVTFGDLHPTGIFVNGDRLTVLGSKYVVPDSPYTYGYYMVDIKTFARVYDIQDRTAPVLLRDLMLTGSYFNSRMIDNYVYFVVSQPAYIIFDTVILPKIYSNNKLVREMAPSEIHFYNGSDNYYQYTTFAAVNLQNETEAPTYMTLMLGGTSSMYASQNNTYITFPEFNGNTTIYRVRIEGNNMTAEAKGYVLGNELNQFSMDEYDGYFRIATATWIDGNPRSNVLVLDMNMSIVGSLLDIEVGETLDSARFMANRCYLSTSIVRRDPFFVIDVENATAPKILGYLKIPGFNRYLHPYDQNHVIGVGRDEFNNVKLSLFDVSNVSAPKNMSEYRFEGDWSDTQALWDHKAFLFAQAKDLLAIPVLTSHYSPDYTIQQGLFVFNITLTNGFILRGNLTHQEVGITGWDSSYHVKRGLYIEDVLYTISDSKIKLNSLDNLELLKEISIV
ncbi:MAG: beta-propeller domain-containing protein [Candidatus Bathyarchaeota archaeon]|nr:MAG: beta-propeller domain-containing protein [Candidatus Bathyarchaeota archaeon]